MATQKKWTTDPQKFAEAGDILMSVRAPVGPVNLATQRICIGRGLAAIRAVEGRLLTSYAFYVLRNMEAEIIGDAGAAFASINRRDIENIQIPLPLLEVQKEIVAEIEGYRKIIDGARTVLDNYRPRIPIHSDWPMVKLGDVARLINGRAYKREELLNRGPTPVLRVGNFFSNREWYYSDLELDDEKYCDKGDLLYAWSASFGPRIWEGPRAIYHYHIWKIEILDSIDKKFLFYLLEADSEKIKSEGNGIAMMHATKSGMEMREFPLPPVAVQQTIVAEIEAEQALVAANYELIERFEKKIRRSSRVFGVRAKRARQNLTPAICRRTRDLPHNP